MCVCVCARVLGCARNNEYTCICGDHCLQHSPAEIVLEKRLPENPPNVVGEVASTLGRFMS